MPLSPEIIHTLSTSSTTANLKLDMNRIILPHTNRMLLSYPHQCYTRFNWIDLEANNSTTTYFVIYFIYTMYIGLNHTEASRVGSRNRPRMENFKKFMLSGHLGSHLHSVCFFEKSHTNTCKYPVARLNCFVLVVECFRAVQSYHRLEAGNQKLAVHEF